MIESIIRIKKRRETVGFGLGDGINIESGLKEEKVSVEIHAIVVLE
jgi:hypothetical protein